MRRRKLAKLRNDLALALVSKSYNEQADVSLLSSEDLAEAPTVIDTDTALEVADDYVALAGMGPFRRLRSTAPISRPCYDKPHRCPGWAGGGWIGAQVSRCRSGSLTSTSYRRRYWLGARCLTCGLYVLPIVTRWLDPTWLWWAVRHPHWPSWAWRVHPVRLRRMWRTRCPK